MARTAEYLKDMLRLRLGELGTDAGTWTDDLLYDILNQAQVVWCRHIFQGVHYPFRRIGTTIPCISDSVIYAYPDDYISTVSIYHHKTTGNKPVKLFRRNLENIRVYGSRSNSYDLGYPATVPVTAGQAGYYQFYDEVGQTGTIIDEGIISQIVEGSTQGTTQFVDENHSGLGPARVGDIVTNLTDNSQAVITDIGSGIFSFEKGWHGGRSNYPQPGDKYTIQTREEHRFTFETFPKITFPDLDITRGCPNYNTYRFCLDRDDQFNIINVKFSQDQLRGVQQDDRFILILSRVQEGDDPDTFLTFETQGQQNIVLQFADDRDPKAAPPLPTEEIEVASFVDARVGNNRIETVSNINANLQLYQNIWYEIALYQAAFNSVERTPCPAQEIALLRPPEDYMTINYIKRAAEFKIPESICELPDELHDGLVERAVITALRYINPDMIPAGLLTNYKEEVKDGREFLANRQPPEVDFVEDDEILGHHTFTPGYSEYLLR